MRIGYDVGPITTSRTGVGNYCFFLLRHLLPILGEHAVVGFSSGRGEIDLEALGQPIEHRHLPIPTRVLYQAWNLTGRPRVDRLLNGVDVYHATNFFLAPTEHAKRVVTIHDLAFLRVPQYCSPKIQGPYARGVRKFCHEADAVMTYSQSTKRDVVELLDVDPEKVVVAPMAVDEGFIPIARDEAEVIVEKDYGIKAPFLLFVSTLEPRKNVRGLIESFAKIADEFPHNLVLIGSVGWNSDDIFAEIAKHGLEERVIRPGFVPHHELPAFYSAADVFVFPTHYEGFGLPLLEALTCGCPVVTSDNSSVPEVTGDGALRVDALDLDGFAEKVSETLSDEKLRASLGAKGMEHAKRFSWHDCAATTLKVYESVVA